MTDITGIIRDSEQNALAGAIVTLRPSKAVVGYNDGAIARRTHVFTANGSGSVTMAGIAPGSYSVTFSVTANDSTSQTVLLETTGVATTAATMTLESFLAENALPINTTILQQVLAARDAAILAQTGAETAETNAEGHAAQAGVYRDQAEVLASAAGFPGGETLPTLPDAAYPVDSYFRLLMGPGVKVYRNDANVWTDTEIWLKRPEYDSVALLLADDSTFTAGEIISVVGVGLYQAVASGGSLGVTNAGGQHFDALPAPDGFVSVTQFGPIGTADDDTVFQRFMAHQNAFARAMGRLPQGTTTFSSSTAITRAGRTLHGAPVGAAQRTGSIDLGMTLKWVGGAEPMFTTTTSAHAWAGFGVETNGQATDFLEMNSGAQRIFMEDMFFPNDQFTRSIVRSNGNRLGYSEFKRVIATKPAPTFLSIDGQGIPQGMVPIIFDGCQFANYGVGAEDPWTVVRIEDEKVELVRFQDGRLISRGGVVAVDTRPDPNVTSLDALVIDGTEIDNVEAGDNPEFRMFELVNVPNVAIRNAIITGDGSCRALFRLVNSHVTEVVNCDMNGIQYMFEADDDSTISGVGVNRMDWSTVQGICDNPNAFIRELAQASAIVIDGSNFPPSQNQMLSVDIDAPGDYTFTLDQTRPQNIETGQQFTIIVRNTSGGAISDVAFGSGFSVSGSPYTAPGAYQQKSFRFVFDGYQATLLSEGEIVGMNTLARIFNPLRDGAYYDPSDLSTMYTDTGGTTAVTTDGDDVNYIEDKSGNGYHLTWSGTTPPVYKTAGGLHWIDFDLADGEFIHDAAFVIPADMTIHAGYDTQGESRPLFLHVDGSTSFFGMIAQDGSTSTGISGVNTDLSELSVDRAAVTITDGATTRDDLHTAIAGKHALTIKIASVETNPKEWAWGDYGSGFGLSGRLYGMIWLADAKPFETRAVEDWLVAKMGGVA